MSLKPQKKRLFFTFACSLLLLACSNEVNYTPPEGSTGLAITHYSYDKLIVDGEVFDIDVVILPNGKITAWSFNRENHRISPNELQSYVTDNIKTLVIGAGLHGEGFLDDEAQLYLKQLEDRGVSVHFLDTIEAVTFFNASAKEGLLTFLHVRN